MKIPIIIVTVTLITIGLVAGLYFYNSTLTEPIDPSQNPSPTPTPQAPGPVAQLQINHLLASSNGTVSFDVSLYEYDSGVLEAVFINETRYSWSDGGTQNTTILKGQTQHWSKEFEALSPGTQIQIKVQATPVWGNATTTVNQPASPNINNFPDFFYDMNSGVGLFNQGIQIIATSQNPLSQLENSHFPESYWSLMYKNITTQATDQDFISILISRGDKPTGGYNLQIESFSWLESYPVKLRFHIDFTDPGEEVIVTQALTNPMVLIPIGKLSSGKYEVEVPIVQYIQTFDDHGNIKWITVMTFKAEIWTQNLTITNSQGSIPLTIFKMEVNENQIADLIVPIDLSESFTREKAEKITNTAFIHVKGENTFFLLDTITFSDQEIAAHYIWGINENDMSHIFDLSADLTSLQIEVTHCR